MRGRSAVKSPERLTITGQDNRKYRGADQDWYPDLWQRQAGCGPTSASLLVSYLAATRPVLRPLYTEACMDQEPFIRLMCRVWDYVTPGCHGLNRPERYAQGISDYAAACGVTLYPEVLELPAARTKRLPFSAYAAFIHKGLDSDCPVAFLNLCSGRSEGLDSWHWVTVIALDGSQATILDSGNQLQIDLALWCETTKKRGGFVAVFEERPV